MSKPKFIFSSVKILLVSLFCVFAVFAQNERSETQKAEPSYDVILQTIIASNASAEKSALPTTLANVVKKLKLNYPLSNYNLSSTYLQRVANTGNVEFKSALSQQNRDTPALGFSEWNLGQLWTLPNAQGTNSIQVRNFKFGQRVPVNSIAGKDADGNLTSSTVYESSLTIQKLSLSENTPTVIGSLTTSKPDEIMFLILTVKSAEN